MYFTNLYPGAFLQLIIGLIGIFGLCNFTVPRILGAVGFIFVYFHVSSFITLLLCFSVSFIPFWYRWVGSLLIISKLFPCIKAFIFCLYSSCVSIVIVFPLSAFTIVSWFTIIFFFMLLIIFHSPVSLIYYITLLANILYLFCDCMSIIVLFCCS
jgi:hypothetical protein